MRLCYFWDAFFATTAAKNMRDGSDADIAPRKMRRRRQREITDRSPACSLALCLYRGFEKYHLL